MIYFLPWEIPELLDNYYSGPCLFAALYRLYRGAYFGQGFHLSGNYINNFELKNSIDKLPLDIKRITFSKIWNEGKPLKGTVVKEGKLHLTFSLHYLFVQYGKLREIIRPRIPRVYAGWMGSQVEKRTYVFSYGPIDPSITPLIPEFMCSEKQVPMSPSFSLICP